MNLHFWQESQWKNAYKKIIESCYRNKRRICTKEGKGIFIVKRREERGVQVHSKIIKKGIYKTL